MTWFTFKCSLFCHESVHEVKKLWHCLHVELKDFWLSLHTENYFQNNEGENPSFCHQQVLILQTAASVKVLNTIHMPIIFNCDGRRTTGAVYSFT